MTAAFDFRTVPHIVFRPGAAARLAEAAAPALASADRVLFVTDPGVRRAGLCEGAIKGLEAAGKTVTVFDEVEADPPELMVEACAEAGRDAHVQAVVALGGGSPMDTAKVANLLIASGQPLREMFGVEQVAGRGLPLVLAPTTAGTGSEVTNVAVITTTEGAKRGIAAGPLYADMAILDPDLTLGLPAHITAYTGVDAMVHAIEAYTNRRAKNPVSDALALAALKKLHGSILRAVKDGADAEARGDMLLGAMLAGQAFSNSPCAGVHAMAYPLGGLFHVPHGLSNSVVLGPVLKFNAPKAGDQYAEIAAHLGLPARASALIEEMETIAAEAKLERRLSELGISHNDVPRMAEDVAANDRLLPNNPREMGYDDIVAMFEEIL